LSTSLFSFFPGLVAEPVETITLYNSIDTPCMKFYVALRKLKSEGIEVSPGPRKKSHGFTGTCMCSPHPGNLKNAVSGKVE
jgi:hypothetical protein